MIIPGGAWPEHKAEPTAGEPPGSDAKNGIRPDITSPLTRKYLYFTWANKQNINQMTQKKSRKIISRSGLLLVVVILAGWQDAPAQQPAKSGWEALPSIVQKITSPRFPRQDFPVLKYGAKADGVTDCLGAIKKAIAACHQSGGGRVVVPAGTYFVKGPIHLQSNVNLFLAKGAVLKFSTDADDYLPLVRTRFEGVALMNYSPLVYAYDQQNIAVTGQGVLDGQADNEHWWNWTGSKRFGWKEGMGTQHAAENEPALMEMATKGIPVSQRRFGKDHYMRPTFVEFYRCSNILIQGITIRNSPFWLLHPTLSKNITIDGVTTSSMGPNNDGCDPESCTDVLIKNCSFTDGDDCIAIKSGRNEDGRRVNVPSKNIIIQDCQMRDGHGGVTIGSETSGGVENVYVQRCKMSSKNLDRAIRIKSNNCRGGVSKNLYFRNIQVGQVREAVIRVNMFYGNEKGPDCHYPPTLSGLYIDHVTSEQSTYAIFIEGGKDKPVDQIRIADCRFNQVKKDNVVTNASHLKIIRTTINGKRASLNGLHPSQAGQRQIAAAARKGRNNHE